VADIIHSLFVLLKTAAFYGPANDAARQRLAETAKAFDAALERSAGVELSIADDELRLDERPLPITAGRDFLLRELSSRGVTALRFLPGLTAAGLLRLVEATLACDPRRGMGVRELRRDVAGVQGLEVLGGEEPVPQDEPPDARAAACRAFFQALSAVEDVMQRLRAGEAADFAPAREAVEGLVRRVIADASTLFELAAIREYDEYTYAHSVNVSVYALALGLDLGLGRELLSELGFAGLFHDVGKVRLPRELIEKPGALSQDEWAQLRRHPALGALLLLTQGQGRERRWARAAAVAFEHHLRFDASGYPRLRWPRRQGLFSRICAIADAFDALTSGRVYEREAVSPGEALRRLRADSGSAFDPRLVDLFASAVAGRIVAHA
jgi:HD-GYP domain-containing protein (c-di-GMP phosphodiesterase class II)